MSVIDLQPRSKHAFPLARCPVCNGTGRSRLPSESVWGFAGFIVLAICRSCLGVGAPSDVVQRSRQENEEAKWGR